VSGLHIHRADRADALAAAIGDLFATPLDDPFAPEVVAVHTRGVDSANAYLLGDRLWTIGAVEKINARLAAGEPPA